MFLTKIAAGVTAEMLRVNELLKQGFIDAGVDPNSNLIESFEVVTDVGKEIIFCSIIGDDYWIWVDQGRGPTKQGPPPGQGVVRGKIKDWVERRGINSSSLNADELAFLISRQIHKEGYKGKFVVDKLFEQIEDEVLSTIDRIIDENYELNSDIS